jgi:hypothetical protein
MTNEKFLDLLGDDIEGMKQYAKALLHLNKQFIVIQKKFTKWTKENPNSTRFDRDMMKQVISIKHFSNVYSEMPKPRKHVK